MRYLRRNHKREDREVVADLVYNQNPDEGRKLISNFDFTDSQKKFLLYDFIYNSPQITFLGFGDQRMGKDATLNAVFQDILDLCKEGRYPFIPRIVTLGNIRKPPFVDESDMYFSFKNIPSGTKEKEVWVYCSEIETVLPAREGTSPENKLFSQLEGTMAQNHQKLFGLVKLASKVDINALRSCNVKFFKFISPEKLSIEGVERANILSRLGYWHLPKSADDKTKTLLVFDNQLFLVDYDLPIWWDDRYSEQFREVPLDKIKDYIQVVHSNGLTVPQIQIAVAQKFRKSLEIDEIKNMVV